MSKKQRINNTKKKIIEFTSLLELFKNHKGTDIELYNKYNDDKYSIQIYSAGDEGNLIINNKSKLHIIFSFNDELVEVAPCDDNDIYHIDLGFSFPTFAELTIINDLIDPDFLNAITDYILNNKGRKSMTFRELLTLFQENKGTKIELDNNYNHDKYSVEIFSTGIKGNFIINGKACVNILFHTREMNCERDFVEFAPCINDICISRNGLNMTLNDDIMQMDKFIDTNFLIALSNYM